MMDDDTLRAQLQEAVAEKKNLAANLTKLKVELRNLKKGFEAEIAELREEIAQRKKQVKDLRSTIGL
jgi:predicted nuclease with TOPRIM domain